MNETLFLQLYSLFDPVTSVILDNSFNYKPDFDLIFFVVEFTVENTEFYP